MHQRCRFHLKCHCNMLVIQWTDRQILSTISVCKHRVDYDARAFFVILNVTVNVQALRTGSTSNLLRASMAVLMLREIVPIGGLQIIRI